MKYILFKNASNCGGIKKRTDDIKKDYVSWQFPIEMLIPVCKALKAQLGDEYNVYVPKSEHYCIKILHRSLLDRITEKELEQDGYKLLTDASTHNLKEVGFLPRNIMKCKYCGTEPNNATAKRGLYVCCCYMLHLESGKYTQHHRDKEADHPTEKGGEG